MATVTETLGTIWQWGRFSSSINLNFADNPGSLFLFVRMPQEDWINEVLQPTPGWALVTAPQELAPPHHEGLVGVYRHDSPPVGSDTWTLTGEHGSGSIFGIRVLLEEGEELLAFAALNVGIAFENDPVLIPGEAPETGTVVMAAAAYPEMPF